MTTKDLIKLKPKGDPYSDEIRAKIKGSVSQRRKIAQTLNALSRSTKLNEQQKMFVSLLKEKKFVDLLVELIALNLKDISDYKRRDKVIEQIINLTKGSPNINILNMQTKTDNIIKWDEWLEEAKKKREEWLKNIQAQKEQKDG